MINHGRNNSDGLLANSSDGIFNANIHLDKESMTNDSENFRVNYDKVFMNSIPNLWKCYTSVIEYLDKNIFYSMIIECTLINK